MSDQNVTSTPDKRLRLTADAALFGIALIWGLTFFMVKDATRDFPVLAFLALRFTLATLVMLPLVLRIKRRPHRSEIMAGVLAGLLVSISYISQTFALRLIGAGRTGFFTGLYVIMTPFLALILLRHRLTTRVFIGAISALSGLLLLSYAPGGNLLGDGLAVLCALTYALQILAVEKFPAGADWRIMATVQLATVAITCGVLLPIMAAVQSCDSGVCMALRPFADPLPTALPLSVLTTALFTGIFASGLALSVQVWGQRILPPSDTALIFAMESPLSALFSAIFKGEVLTAQALAGCALIFLGMLITAFGSLAPPGEPLAVQEKLESA